ncbi:MAG: hypothetical protein OXC26_24655 [Albidovulum sp.]|nr:hypothetical protein [Albidovulum sp.]
MKRIRECLDADNGPRFSGSVEMDEGHFDREATNKHSKTTPKVGRSANGKTAAAGTTVYTDEAAVRKGMSFEYDNATHSLGECVNGAALAKCSEIFRALRRLGCRMRARRVSEENLHRFAREFTGRFDIRDLDAIERTTALARDIPGRRRKYVNFVVNAGAGR